MWVSKTLCFVVSCLPADCKGSRTTTGSNELHNLQVCTRIVAAGRERGGSLGILPVADLSICRSNDPAGPTLPPLSLYSAHLYCVSFRSLLRYTAATTTTTIFMKTSTGSLSGRPLSLPLSGPCSLSRSLVVSIAAVSAATNKSCPPR